MIFGISFSLVGCNDCKCANMSEKFAHEVSLNIVDIENASVLIFYTPAVLILFGEILMPLQQLNLPELPALNQKFN